MAYGMVWYGRSEKGEGRKGKAVED